MTELEFLKSLADKIAKGMHDGHWTLMKFTTNWRFGFITPSERECIDGMKVGDTAEEAMSRGIYARLGEIFYLAKCQENLNYREEREEQEDIKKIYQLTTAKEVRERLEEEERQRIENLKTEVVAIKKINHKKGK